jgi:ribosome-associated heat shock protein Hsp15
MTTVNSIRIDKFLWSARIFKTRNIAAEECRKGRILINGLPVKPSRNVVKDEIIVVRKLPVIYTYRIIEPVEHRLPAKLVVNYIEDLTSAEEKAKSLLSRQGLNSFREKGTGRPTKKERRSLERFKEGFDKL